MRVNQASESLSGKSAQMQLVVTHVVHRYMDKCQNLKEVVR